MGGKRPRRVLTLRNLPCTPPPSPLLLLLFHPPPPSSSPLRRAENAVAPFPAVTFSQPVAVCCADSERKEPKRKGSLFYISRFPPTTTTAAAALPPLPVTASGASRRLRAGARGAPGGGEVLQEAAAPLSPSGLLRRTPPDAARAGPDTARVSRLGGDNFFLFTYRSLLTPSADGT